MKAICVKCSKNRSQFISTDEEKKDGIIFTLPAILWAVGAVGSLAFGTSAEVTAVNKKKNEDKLLQETVRHNKAVEQNLEGLYVNLHKNLISALI